MAGQEYVQVFSIIAVSLTRSGEDAGVRFGFFAKALLKCQCGVGPFRVEVHAGEGGGVEYNPIQDSVGTEVFIDDVFAILLHFAKAAARVDGIRRAADFFLAAPDERT